MKSNVEITPPAGAGSYIKERLEKDGHSPSAIARTVGVSPSTITRLFSGAELSVQLAAKLNKHYNLNIEELFTLDAKRKIHLATELAESK